MKIVAVQFPRRAFVIFNAKTTDAYDREIVWDDFVSWLDDRSIMKTLENDHWNDSLDPSRFYAIEIDTSDDDLMFEFKHRFG